MTNYKELAVSCGYTEDKYSEFIDYLLCQQQDITFQTISLLTKNFYNNLYHDVKKRNLKVPIVQIIIGLLELVDYGFHILLDKLFRITVDVHMDIDRQKLTIRDEANGNQYETNSDQYSLDIFEKTLSIQINLVLKSYNLSYALSRHKKDNVEYVDVPDDHDVFEIEIEEYIPKSYQKYLDKK